LVEKLTNNKEFELILLIFSYKLFPHDVMHKNLGVQTAQNFSNNIFSLRNSLAFELDFSSKGKSLFPKRGMQRTISEKAS
jgi:hypothetical protein